MRIASYNVHKCRGTDGRRRPDRIATVLSEIQADIVALQEVDRRFGRRTGLLDTAAVRDKAGLHLVAASAIEDGHGWHGNALLVSDRVTVVRAPQRLDLPGFEPRGALLSRIIFDGLEIRILCAHLGLMPRDRVRQARKLLSIIKEDGEHTPTVLLGDLNEWRHDASALSVLSSIFGVAASCPSFPSQRPWLSLDRILATGGCQISGLRAHSSALARLASDHLPLQAELTIAE